MKNNFNLFLPSFLYFLCVWDALKPKPEIKRQLPTPLKYRLKKNFPVKITLNEVAHSVFYAPLYVAIEKGYFKDENIDLTHLSPDLEPIKQ